MKTSTYNHKYFKHIINKEMVCLDATMGNGNDTYFLAINAKKVYAFDIQEDAFINTKKRCSILNNIIYINDNHQNINKYINEKIDIAMFNLGYLPKSKSNIVSVYKTTIKAIKASYELLKPGGYLSIISYRGHIGGLMEYHAIEELFKIEKYFILEKYYSYSSETEPILFIIRK